MLFAPAHSRQLPPTFHQQHTHLAHLAHHTHTQQKHTNRHPTHIHTPSTPTTQIITPITIQHQRQPNHMHSPTTQPQINSSHHQKPKWSQIDRNTAYERHLACCATLLATKVSFSDIFPIEIPVLTNQPFLGEKFTHDQSLVFVANVPCSSWIWSNKSATRHMTRLHQQQIHFMQAPISAWEQGTNSKVIRGLWESKSIKQSKKIWTYLSWSNHQRNCGRLSTTCQYVHVFIRSWYKITAKEKTSARSILLEHLICGGQSMFQIASLVMQQGNQEWQLHPTLPIPSVAIPTYNILYHGLKR